MKNTVQNMKTLAARLHRVGIFGLAALLAGPVTAQQAATKLQHQQGMAALPVSVSNTILPHNTVPVLPIQKATTVRTNTHKMAAIASTATGGNWSAPATWVGGVVPGAADAVTIVAGATVTLDVNASAGSLSIDATGSLLTSATTNYKLEVGGNVTNNGTLDLSNSATIGSDLRFISAGNATFTGTGTTDLHTMSLAKSVRADIVDMNLPTLSVKGSTTSGDGFLFTRAGSPAADDMTGTLKISGTATISNKVFGNAAGYIIPATGGFWLSNPNFTVVAQNASPTVNGLLRVSDGVFNVGTASGNSLNFGAGSTLTVEGGTINAAGRVTSFTSATAPTTTVTFNMSGGTINVSTIGNASGTPSFGFNGPVSLLGGTIVLVQRSTATTPLDYYMSATGGTLGTTTLQVGSAATATNFDFRIRGYVSSLNIDNTGTPKSVLLAGNTFAYGTTLINPGTTLNLNSVIFIKVGPTLTNNGTLTGSTTGSRLYFQGSVAQTVGGTGTYTSPIAQVTFQNSGPGVTINAPITTRNIAMFRGNVINSANLTVLADATTLGLISFGLTAPTSAAGSFDVSPTFNISASGLYLIYNPETAPRTTGTEVPPGRSLYYLDINNPQGITLAGGNITVAGPSSVTVPALTLLAGIVTTSPTSTLVVGPASTILPNGSATSYVNGPMAVTVNSATPVSRTLAVGDAAGWRPVVIGGITTSADQTFTATVISGATGGSVSGPISSLNPTRYVRIENSANLPATATVQLSYGTGDVIGAPATAVVAQAPTANGVFVSRGGALATVPTTGIVSTQNIVPGNDFFVIGNTEGGSLATSVASVCSGTNTGTLTLTGIATGATITGYEADAGSGFTAVSGTNTNPTYTFSNLTATTTFRAVILTSDNRTVNSAPITITVTPGSSAAFAYSGSTFCLSGTNPSPTITGTTGGSFSAGTGLSIDATTGAINLTASTPGTYTVTYAVAGTCPSSSTATVTITSAPTATFSYSATSFCQGGATSPTPTFPTGSSAGTFSSTTGLSINASTGAINLAASTPGTYTVTNNIAASGGCAAATATTTVTINTATTAVFNFGTTNSFCTTSTAVTPTVTGNSGGTFSSTTGLTINATTGTITPGSSTAGTYTVTYSVGGACPSTGTQTVTITAPATASFTYAASAFCSSATAAVTPTLGAGSTAGTFTSTTGLTINATTGAITPSTSTAGTYTVTNTIPASGGCAAVTATQTVTINATPATPVITQIGSTLSSSAATGNQWYLNGTALTGASGQTFTPTVAGNYTVIATANGCASATSAAYAVISVGIKDNMAGMDVSVYPNPNSGAFSISLTGYRSDATITIYNIAGQTIAVETIKAGEEVKNMQLTGLAAGTYLLKVASDKGVQVSRLLVQ